jgi:hypothetical protein
MGIPGFFSYLPEKFKNFRKFATRIMAMFGSTYVCVWTVIFLHGIKKNFSENKADWSTLVIFDQSRNCTNISARHTKNCHWKEVSSLRTKH